VTPRAPPHPYTHIKNPEGLSEPEDDRAHQQAAGLVQGAVLEGGDGADPGGAAVLRQDHLRERHRGKTAGSPAAIVTRPGGAFRVRETEEIDNAVVSGSARVTRGETFTCDAFRYRGRRMSNMVFKPFEDARLVYWGD